MIPHVWGVLGLAINALGSVGLLLYVRNPYERSPLTREQWESFPALNKAFTREIALYRWSVSALFFGFVLQLIDLLTT